MKAFIREALCENGIPSSKRVIGCLAYIIYIICCAYLTYKYGADDVVQALLQTLVVAASGLLGISSVTSIWKEGKTQMKE